jgi:ribosomal protein L7Ae-like RNA K-turn-binding protein
VAPDLAERLPGRGVWVSARREAVERAAAKRLFARGFKAQAAAPENLAAMVADGLTRRLIEALGLARKAGLAVTGFEKVRARLRAGPVAALIEASDGSAQGLEKLRPLAGDAPRVDVLSAAELGLAFGREFVIHAALDAGGAADRVLYEASRLAGFRTASHHALPDDGEGAAKTRPGKDGS